MTFLQPNKNRSMLNIILIFMGICTVLSSVWLVMLYNKMVNLNHGLSEMKSELSDIQAENLAAKAEVFDRINASNPADFGNLIQEKNPEYLETRSTWSFASDY